MVESPLGQQLWGRAMDVGTLEYIKCGSDRHVMAPRHLWQACSGAAGGGPMCG